MVFCYKLTTFGTTNLQQAKYGTMKFEAHSCGGA